MEAVATETLLSAPGQYVLAYSHHFVAARLTSEGDLQVNLSHRTHQWHKLLARAGGGGSALRFCPNQHCMILDYTLLDAVFAIRLVEGSSTAHHTAEWAGTDCPGFPLGSGYIGGSVQEDAKAHWLRITQNRAVALRKKRKHDAQSKANELSFDDLWEMSMSPVCCPTYGVNTSRIRLPLRCLHQAHVPHLAQGPSDFLREALPLSSCSLLEITNKHSRDKDIRFEPCTHTYYVKGLRVSCSVTGLVHMFANEFDPDKCIARMQQGHLVKSLQRASLFCRWLAASSLPELHRHFVDEARDNPEASTLFYMWTVAEDAVLDAWLEHVQAFHPSHLSLHFDGIRVSSNAVGEAVQDFCAACSRHIEAKAGFKVHIRPKTHGCFLQLVAQKGSSSPLHCAEQLLEPGNCILRGLFHLGFADDAIRIRDDTTSEYGLYLQA